MQDGPQFPGPVETGVTTVYIRTHERDALIEQIFEALECIEPLSRDFIGMMLEDVSLFDRKQHDRGPTNIAAYGQLGILMRLADKMTRLKRILWHGWDPQVSEPVENEFADLSVYGVMARLLERGQWTHVSSAQARHGSEAL